MVFEAQDLVQQVGYLQDFSQGQFSLSQVARSVGPNVLNALVNLLVNLTIAGPRTSEV